MKILKLSLWFVFFVCMGLFFGCKDLLEPPAERPPRGIPPACVPGTPGCPQTQEPCDPSKGACPNPQPPCDPSKGACPKAPVQPCDPSKGNCSPGDIDSTQFFTITNMLNLGPNEYLVIDDNGRREVALPSGKCAKVHHSLHGVTNLSIRRDRKYLKICRPRGLRNSYPERGTQKYTCNHGRGFEGDIQNYKIENERNVIVDTETPPETCPVVVQ